MTQTEKNLLSACESAEDFINGIENYNDEARAIHEELREAIKTATEQAPEITEEEETRRGVLIAKTLLLKQIRTGSARGRFNTDSGTKTALGLYRTLKSIFTEKPAHEEHKRGPWLIAVDHKEAWPTQYAVGYRVIVDAEGFEVCRGYMGSDNAALILAAPDMLAALKAALEMGDEFEAEKLARAALAKAEAKL